VLLLLSFFTAKAPAQLVYQQQIDKYSAILPLTLNDDVYRVRAKPPEGVTPLEINCDIGISGTVLTDQRGTSANDEGEKVLSSLMHKDKVDVMFSDRVYSGHRTYEGNKLIDKYDFDCGINIKYQNKKKVAQVEIRVGYVLPSGDVEGLTWSKIRRKIRQLGQNINKCETCDEGISNLERERSALINSAEGGNQVQVTRANARLSGIQRQIIKLNKYKSEEGSFRRDLAAFASLEEYLKTKVNGSQVFVHFHHDGKTLPVDIDELKRARIRPIQVFEEGKDPIKDGG
jgi:hypothetical protein